MAMMFVRAIDFIKERRFEVLAPTFYHPNMSSDSLDLTPPKREKPNRFRFVPVNFLNPTPMRMDVDPDLMQNCAYPVETMLDMFQKNVPFQIVYDNDIPEIFDGLDRYLLTIQPEVESGIEYSIVVARLVIKWRAEVYKHYYRYMMLNPAAKDALYPKNNSVENIFTLLSKASGLNYDEFQHDPLKSRRNPPYDVDRIMPSKNDGKNGRDLENDSASILNKRAEEQFNSASKFDLKGFLSGN